MSKFLPRVCIFCIALLICSLSININLFAQKNSTSNSMYNDIDTEALFGQSIINDVPPQPIVLESYSNTYLFKSRPSRKVTLDCLPGDDGCEIDEPIDSQILFLIVFVFIFSVYSLNKKLAIV